MVIDFLGNFFNKKNFMFIGLLLLLIWFLWNNIDMAFMLFASIIFACSLAPLVDKLSKKMSRGLATTIVIVALIVISCAVLIPIFAVGAYEISAFIDAFSKYVTSLDDTTAGTTILDKFHISPEEADAYMTSFSNSVTGILGSVVEFVKGIGSAFIYIFTSIIFLFFFLADQQLVKETTLKLFPENIRERTGELLENIGNRLGGYVVAQALVSGSVWITMTIGLLLFKIQYAWILGLIAGVLSIIPVVGSALSLIICLIATYEFGLKVLIIITVLFTISHFVENHVVRPFIYSKMLNLHPIIIFIALFIGGKYAGVTGIIFGPPIAMALCILLDELYVKKEG